MALNNASKMLALVGLVLDMNRLEAGRLPLRIAQYDKAEFLRNITERFQIWAKQNNQNIIYHNHHKQLAHAPLQREATLAR